MKLEVSLGEAIDKLNILEIKKTQIDNIDKIREIQKEIDELNECHMYKTKYEFFYNLLTYVNEYIWNTTDMVKTIRVSDPHFAILSSSIFEFNQKRFRIKSWFNILESSNIKEQKSYGSTKIYIDVFSIDTIYNKIAEINYLLLEFDIVYFVNTNELLIKTMKKLFKQPNLHYDTNMNNAINIGNFFINEPKSNFEYPVINYISGGLLGDFIHQLSIVNEIFIETGRKGNLYISNIVGDRFRFGVEKAYQDTYQMIHEQNYINEYKIYSSEKININLSQWRHSHLLYRTNWQNVFKFMYGVEWGNNPWLILPKNDIWKDKIIINYTLIRKIDSINIEELYKKYGKKIIFMGFNIDGYEDLKQKNIFIDYYSPNSLYDFAVAINSCELFIGGLSSPLAFAFALHKTTMIGYNTTDNIADNIHVVDLPFSFIKK
jgi:hypothetical protein